MSRVTSPLLKRLSSYLLKLPYSRKGGRNTLMFWSSGDQKLVELLAHIDCKDKDLHNSLC